MAGSTYGDHRDGHPHAIAHPLAQWAGHRRCWCAWRYTTDKRKLPLKIDGSGTASIADPATWATLGEVLEALPRLRAAGVMIALTPDLRLLAVDWDDCIQQRRLKTHAAEFVRAAQSYAELSPSNRGIHVWLALQEPWQPQRSRLQAVEVYTSRRFLTVTGRALRVHDTYVALGEAYPLRHVSISEAKQLLLPLGYSETQPTQVAQAVSTADDSALIERILASKQGAKFQRLLNGDTSGYPSPSEADEALCCMLAWWTRDAAQIERIWLASGLGQREKVQKRQDYRQRTIAFALRHTRPKSQQPAKDRISRLATNAAKLLEGGWQWS